MGFLTFVQTSSQSHTLCLGVRVVQIVRTVDFRYVNLTADNAEFIAPLVSRHMKRVFFKFS